MSYHLVGSFTGQESDGFQDVPNGYIMSNTTADVEVRVVPFGNQYPAALVTSSAPNQFDGVCNGTFTSTANATAATNAATTLTGDGSGATFTYVFDASGDLSTIVCDGAGTGYKEGDKLSITTTAAHGSQTIEFRLVKGSNRTELNLYLVHDRANPLAFPIREVRVNGASDRTLLYLKQRG